MNSAILPPERLPACLWGGLLCLSLVAVRADASLDPPRESAATDDVAYGEALGHYAAGNFRQALAVIRRAAEAGGWTVALRSLAGWCRLRGGEIDAAETEFQAALAIDRAAVDPRVGLSYVLMRRGSPAEAEIGFRAALRSDAGNLDALKGLGLALRDQKKYADAAQVFRDALRLKPGDAETRAYLDQALAAGGGGPESRPRSGAPPDAAIEVIARARDGRFWVGGPHGGAGGGRFQPLFLKGVNMGVALPGRFPAEFPLDQGTYGRWIRDLAELGANAVRLYTLLPPPFYAALLDHNQASGRSPLWLVQGVWTEPPEGDDYDGGPFVEEFRQEIRRVVDAVHGNLDLPARPGHASGAYRADVSRFVLAYVLGREWEPHSVRTYDGRFARADRESFLGTYFTARLEDGASPFEQWLARTMDYAVGYETATYRQQRPVSFASWPTLDPLRHPTESTPAEEAEALGRRGEADQAKMIRDYNECEDCVSVDAAHIVPTDRAQGGGFATYHAYPYYPDFMNQDPGYGRARDSEGASRYIGYLRDLKAHHGAQPVLIGEVGVPSSRGVAHQQPQGWHHGGHTEREMGEIDARLMRNVHEAGLAGGILFSLLDEWFKRSWLVLDFELPAERKPLWLNVLDAEEHYGILAARPGEKGWRVTIDGRPDDWSGIAPLVTRARGGPERPFGDGHDAARTLRGLAVTSDEAYLYVRLDVDRLDADGDGTPDWDRAAYLIGIDTYDPRRGDHRLPIRDSAASPAGLEFCIILDGPGTARLLVDVPYDIQTHRHRRPYGSVENADGRFMEIKAETNRRRVARDGTIFPALQWSLSPLRHASMDPGDRDHSTLADWRAGVAANVIEVRIGWGLLNVTDPSSRRVLHDDPGNLRKVGTVETPGFRFYAAAVRPEGAAGGTTPIEARLADRLPPGDLARPSDLPIYTWPGWDRPAYRIERKEAWPILKRALEAIPTYGGAP